MSRPEGIPVRKGREEVNERRKPTPEEARAILSRLSQLSHEQKADLAARAKPLVAKRDQSRPVQDRAPQTDDELHAAIIRETGFDIPRVAVCEDHCAPFDPIADGFFHRYPGILIMKSREAGGTLNASILQYMLCKYVPTHEGVTYGAIEAQANKAFEYVKRFTEERVQGADGLVTRRIKPEIEGEPLRKRIAWKVGSLLSVIIATVAGTNSPHPNTAHADEYDLMDEDVIAQAANMASSSVAPDGSRIPALDIITSTRKSMHGPMQRLIEEIEEAEKNGYESSYRLYAFCFAPETLVRTLRGYVPISEVWPGDMVLSDDGVFRRVSRRIVRAYKGELIRTRTRTGLAVRSTPDHRFRTVVDDWNNGVPASKPTSNRRSGADGGYREDWAKLEDLDRSSFVRVVVPTQTFDLDRIEPPDHTLGDPSDGRRRKSHTSYELTDDFLWAVGLYVAEGHSSQGLIGFSLHQDEVLYEQRLRDLFEPLGFTVKRFDGVGSPGSCSTQICVYSTQLSEWWSEWIGKGCENKRIPSELMNLPIEKLKVVAEGVLDGDGCDSTDVLHQTSSVLALQMSEIALRCGGVPMVAVPKQRPGRKQTYTVTRASGRVLALRTGTRWQHKSPRGHWEHDGHRFSRIVEYEREQYEGLVYDLTVEGDPSFVVGNALVHNCVGEISEEVPMCRSVPEEQRRARLIEKGMDPNLVCDCDRVVKGEWSEGVPRTLESVCRGRFFRSRGWMPHDDVKRKFRKNTQTVWEAELECRRPMVDGLYLPAWNRSRYLTNGWMPRPELGPVFTGTDWGGTDLSYVIWSQFLLLPVTIRKRDGTEVEIPRFSYVVFDELYDAEAGATRLADMVVAREVAWRRQVPGFSVKHRFADMAGKQQRNDWKQHNPPLRTIWPLPSRDFDPMVRCLQGLVEDQRYWVDERCSHHVDDIESWRQKNGRELHDASSHSMAASRYLHTSTELLHKRQQRSTTSTGDSILPVIVQRQPSRDGGVAISGRDDSFADEQRWRGKLGGPIPMGWR